MKASKTLIGVVRLLGRHKKKTILVVFIALCYAAWKNREYIPFKKFADKVMSQVMQMMDKQMKHQQFVQASTETLMSALGSLNQNRLIEQLNFKYTELFRFENLRNQIRTGAKTLSKEDKVKIWQNIIDELIHFIFFTLTITRQTLTLHTIRSTLVGKYRNDFFSILKDSSSSGIGLLNDILQQACDELITSSLKPTLNFIRDNTPHQIKSTTQMDFNDTVAALKSIQQELFKTERNTYHSSRSKKSPLTSNKDRHVEKLLNDPQDPAYDPPSIFSKIIGLPNLIGKFILPNMYPNDIHLSSHEQGFQLLAHIFQLNQEESVAEMNSNRIITQVFKAYHSRIQRVNQNGQDINLDESLEEESKSNMNDSLEASQLIDTKRLNGISSVNPDDGEQLNQRIEKSKILCSLVLKEFRDILNLTSMQSYFYFTSLLDLRRFLNRLLLALQKKNELETKQPFARISTYFDKLISEEFISENSDKNNQEFYEVRIKKCFNIIKQSKAVVDPQENVQQSEQQQQQLKQLPSTDASADAALVSSQENKIFFNSADRKNLVPEHTESELQIHLNILKEIEQNNILEDALKEMTKRIFFEREQTTIPIEIPKSADANRNQAASQEDSPLDLMSLLSGGNAGQAGDLMSLLSKI